MSGSRRNVAARTEGANPIEGSCSLAKIQVPP